MRVFRFAYSLAIAILLVAVVILGTETVFNEPTFADYDQGAGRQFVSVREFDDAREDYFRSVSATAAVIGVVAIVAGAAQSRLLPVVPLGLVMGGLGAVMYGVAKWLSGPGELSMSALFFVLAGGLILLLAAGYWRFGILDSGGTNKPTT